MKIQRGYRGIFWLVTWAEMATSLVTILTGAYWVPDWGRRAGLWGLKRLLKIEEGR